MSDDVNYLYDVAEAWGNMYCKRMTKYVSLKDNHVFDKSIHTDSPEDIVGDIIDKPLDEVIVSHLKVVYYITRDR